MRIFPGRIFLIIGIAWLCMASIRKNEDPAATAQTGPISLKQKLEEEKDGKKGAPSPPMTFYANNKFMVTPAVDKHFDAAETAGAAKETGEGLDPEKGQETPKTAVEDEENWWSEGDEESFSKTAPSKPGS